MDKKRGCCRKYGDIWQYGKFTLQRTTKATTNKRLLIQSDEFNWNTIIVILMGKGLDPINRFNPAISLCLFPYLGHGFPTSYVMVYLSSMIWDERWLYVLLRLLELLTVIIHEPFLRYFIFSSNELIYSQLNHSF